MVWAGSLRVKMTLLSDNQESSLKIPATREMIRMNMTKTRTITTMMVMNLMMMLKNGIQRWRWIPLELSKSPTLSNGGRLTLRRGSREWWWSIEDLENDQIVVGQPRKYKAISYVPGELYINSTLGWIWRILSLAFLHLFCNPDLCVLHVYVKFVFCFDLLMNTIPGLIKVIIVYFALHMVALCTFMFLCTFYLRSQGIIKHSFH